MRISGGDQKPKYDPSIKKVSREEKVGKLDQKTSTSQLSDEVKLSDQALLVKKARKKMDDLPIIRVEKVNPIHEAIQDGSYEINDKEVAEKIVDETLKDELL